MNRIPLFDSLTHPTISGDWLLPRYKGVSHFSTLIEQMTISGTARSLAVGMEGVGDYDEKSFVELTRSWEGLLLPIAYFPVGDWKDRKGIVSKLKSLKKMGYVGIKLHPRFSGFSLTDMILPTIIKEAVACGLGVLFCTHFYSPSQFKLRNNLDTLLTMLTSIDDSPIILLHGGTVRLLEMMEIARCLKNVVLDLSSTICKYQGSSLDSDIKFLFSQFDERICIGSDFPEYSQAFLRDRFEEMSVGINPEKLRRVACENLESYFSCLS